MHYEYCIITYLLIGKMHVQLWRKATDEIISDDDDDDDKDGDDDDDDYGLL